MNVPEMLYRSRMWHEFSLILTQPEVTEEDADTLYAAGCDDVSRLTREGITRLQFDPHAANLGAALASANQSVEQAGLAVARVEIEWPSRRKRI
jgi:hypothetical protein